MTQAHAATLFGAEYEALAQKYRPIFQRIRDTALQREHNRQLGVDPIQWLKEVRFGAVRVPVEYGGDGATLPQLFQTPTPTSCRRCAGTSPLWKTA